MKIVSYEEYMLSDMPTFTGVVKTDGGIHHIRNGAYHREDGPAIEWLDGSQVWKLNGRSYTEDGHRIEMKIRSSSVGKLLTKKTEL